MLPNCLATEAMALLAQIEPDAYSNTTYETDWIDASKFEQFLAMISVGTLGSSATVDALLEYSTDGTTDSGNITGKAITQLTQAGSDSDKVAFINLRGSEINSNARYFRLAVTIGTAASDMAAYVFGFYPTHGPASDNDIAAVDEIVT